MIVVVYTNETAQERANLFAYCKTKGHVISKVTENLSEAFADTQAEALLIWEFTRLQHLQLVELMDMQRKFRKNIVEARTDRVQPFEDKDADTELDDFIARGRARAQRH